MDPATLSRFRAVCPTDLACRSKAEGRARGRHLRNLWAIRSRFEVPLEASKLRSPRRKTNDTAVVNPAEVYPDSGGYGRLAIVNESDEKGYDQCWTDNLYYRSIIEVALNWRS